MVRRPPRSTQSRSSAASDVYKRQGERQLDHGRLVQLFLHEVVAVGRRDDGLAGGRQLADEEPAASVVELAHHVVQEECALLAGARRRQLLLREQQRQHGGALLALRAEEAQVAAAARQIDGAARGSDDGGRNGGTLGVRRLVALEPRGSLAAIDFEELEILSLIHISEPTRLGM